MLDISELHKHLIFGSWQPTSKRLRYIYLVSIKKWTYQDFPGGPWLGLCASTPGAADSVPPQVTKIPHAVECNQNSKLIRIFKVNINKKQKRANHFKGGLFPPSQADRESNSSAVTYWVVWTWLSDLTKTLTSSSWMSYIVLEWPIVNENISLPQNLERIKREIASEAGTKYSDTSLHSSPSLNPHSHPGIITSTQNIT